MDTSLLIGLILTVCIIPGNNGIALKFFCKPTIEISNQQAHYICKGPGNPPRYDLQTIHVEYSSQRQLDGVSRFKATDQSLHAVPEVIFKSFRNLRDVTLSNIQLKSLRQTNFQEATALKKLRIDSNDIPELQRNLFSHAPYLENLELPRNNIQFVHKQAFSGLHHIQKIGLNDNRIIMLSSMTFSPLKTLTYIDLANNFCISSRFGSTFDAEQGISTASCNNNYRNKEIYFTQIYRL